MIGGSLLALRMPAGQTKKACAERTLEKVRLLERETYFFFLAAAFLAGFAAFFFAAGIAFLLVGAFALPSSCTGFCALIEDTQDIGPGTTRVKKKVQLTDFFS